IFDPILVTNAGNYTVAISNLSAGVSSLTSTQRVVLVKAWGYQATDPSPSLTNAVAVAAGYTGEGSSFGPYFALRADGKLTAWGSSSYGSTNIPSSLSNSIVTAIAAGWEDGLALRSD